MGFLSKKDDFKPTLEQINAKAVILRQGLLAAGVSPAEINDVEVTDLARRALIKEHEIKAQQERLAQEQEKANAKKSKGKNGNGKKKAPTKTQLQAYDKAVDDLIAKHPEIMKAGNGYYFFEGQERVTHDRVQILQAIKERYGETPDLPDDWQYMGQYQPAHNNGNGKAKKKTGLLTKAGRKPKPKPFKVTASAKETLNLHATKIMPKDERLYFNDPKAVELPIKIVPRLKLIVEAMSTNVKKPMRPYIIYAIAGVIAVLAISILFSAVITPQQDQSHKRTIELLEECARLNMTNCNVAVSPAAGGDGGGGLFDFKPINPFQPPDFTKPRN